MTSNNEKYNFRYIFMVPREKYQMKNIFQIVFQQPHSQQLNQEADYFDQVPVQYLCVTKMPEKFGEKTDNQ